MNVSNARLGALEVVNPLGAAGIPADARFALPDSMRRCTFDA
ncbi:hypothetical protein [Paenarthrobacter nitroguajacolicus]|nr:hypothetical protein [Paenarthrobacter nitroguajacolicus]